MEDIFVARVKTTDKVRVSDHVRLHFENIPVYGLTNNFYSKEYMVIVLNDPLVAFRGIIQRHEDDFELEDDNVTYVDASNGDLQPFYDALTLWLL